MEKLNTNYYYCFETFTSHVITYPPFVYPPLVIISSILLFWCRILILRLQLYLATLRCVKLVVRKWVRSV